MISLDYIRVFTPIAALLINATFQIIGCRYLTKRNMMKSFVIGLSIGLSSLLLLEFYNSTFYSIIDQDFWFILLFNIIFYIGLSFCYLQIIGLGVSLRIRMLYYLENAPEGMTYDEISRKFDINSLFEKRIERLVQNKQIEEKDGRYYSLKSFLLYLARLNMALKKIIIGKESEFD